jgi:hypothetical protein
VTHEEIERLYREGQRGDDPKPRISLSRMVAGVRRKVKRQLAADLALPVLLLEEALRFVIAFENFQHTRKLSANLAAFVLQLGRVRSDLLAIRELIYLGQETSALAVARVFVEDIEITMAAAIDSEFALGYSEAPDREAFWMKNIGYGKIYPYVQRFVEGGRGTREQVEAKLEHHRALKTFLSNHVHPNISSAFRTVFPAILDRPGLFAFRPLGTAGENFGPLCCFIAEEIHGFAACCINMFIGKNPPPALAGYIPNSELNEALGYAHVLQELSTAHVDELYEAHSTKSRVWDQASFGDGDET